MKLFRSPSRRRARKPQHCERGRADCERHGVDDEDDPGIRSRGDHAGDRGPDDEGHAPREAEERVRLLEARRADRRRHEAGRGRLEERLGGSVDRNEDDEVPELRCAAEEQDRERRLNRACG